jgi:hypothetical protein
MGCKVPKNNNVTISEHLNEQNIEIIEQNREEIVKKLTNHSNYSERIKLFYITNIDQINFLKIYSQEELSEHIEALSVSTSYHGNKLEDLEFLENFKHIKWLDIRFGDNIDNINDIEAFKYLENLEILEIMDMKKNIDLSPVSHLKNLKDLTFRYSEIKDLSPISDLKNLEFLYMYKNEVENLNPIYKLINLKRLRFDWQENDIDIIHIGKLQNLEYLDLSFITQDNLDLLVNLKKLKTLETDFFIGNDIAPLLKLESLEKLRISYNRSINYTPLANISSLKEIEFRWPSYDDMSDFRYNKMSIFEENGIYTPLGDWR